MGVHNFQTIAEHDLKKKILEYNTCADRLKEARWQRDEAEIALKKSKAEKDALQKSACETSQRHYQNIKGVQKAKDIAEYELKKVTQDYNKLVDKHRVMMKGFKDLLKEREAWPHVLTKFERLRGVLVAFILHCKSRN